jgi:hypothetical protein
VLPCMRRKIKLLLSLFELFLIDLNLLKVCNIDENPIYVRLHNLIDQKNDINQSGE